MPPANWFKAGFDDSVWKEGLAGFGAEGTPRTIVRTAWKSPDIWLRREFILNREDLRGVMLQVHHDEDSEIYLNGVLAAQAGGYSTNYYEMKIEAQAAATLKAGPNLLAVHCHQTSGGQYIDVGLVVPQVANDVEIKK
jgi:hypothetical protein